MLSALPATITASPSGTSCAPRPAAPPPSPGAEAIYLDAGHGVFRDDKSTAPRRISNPWSSSGLTQPTTTSSMRDVSRPLRSFNTTSSPAPSASAWSRLARRPHCRSLEAFGCASFVLCQELGMALIGRSRARARAVAVATVWRAKKASGSPPTSRANPAAKCGSIAATAAHPSTRR